MNLFPSRRVGNKHNICSCMLFTRVQIAFVVTSFLLSITLTPAVRAFARHRGMVAQPKTDRWHKKPTAMLGGLAIWLSVIGTHMVFTTFGLIPESTYDRTILNASTFLFLVGLVERSFPYQALPKAHRANHGLGWLSITG